MQLRCAMIKKKKEKKLITVVIDPIQEASFYSIRFSLASLCHQRGGDGSGNLLVINIYYIQFVKYGWCLTFYTIRELYNPVLMLVLNHFSIQKWLSTVK